MGPARDGRGGVGAAGRDDGTPGVGAARAAGGEVCLAVAPEGGAALDDALTSLLAVEPYLAYATFAAIAPGLHALHRGWWRAAEERGPVLVARDGTGCPVAAIRIDERGFESRHFGLRMARVEPPRAAADEGTAPRGAARALRRRARDAA